MSDDNEIVLFVVEGEKDCEIINSLIKHYAIDDTITKPVIYRSNIYQLFNVFNKAVKQHEGEDESDFEILNTFQILKDITTDEHRQHLDYEEEDISEIYLFFDLDAHTNQARKNENCISEMLKLFSDEFDKGKLYISYPMVEAYKHPFNINDLVPLNNKPKYKTFVSDLCNEFGTELNKIEDIDTSLWHCTLVNHLKVINDLLYSKFDTPQVYQPIEFSQPLIYQTQLEKHILPNQQVRVISPFVLFLLDYLGNPLLDKWKALDETNKP